MVSGAVGALLCGADEGVERVDRNVRVALTPLAACDGVRDEPSGAVHGARRTTRRTYKAIGSGWGWWWPERVSWVVRVALALLAARLLVRDVADGTVHGARRSSRRIHRTIGSGWGWAERAEGMARTIGVALASLASCFGFHNNPYGAIHGARRTSAWVHRAVRAGRRAERMPWIVGVTLAFLAASFFVYDIPNGAVHGAWWAPCVVPGAVGTLGCRKWVSWVVGITLALHAASYFVGDGSGGAVLRARWMPLRVSWAQRPT